MGIRENAGSARNYFGNLSLQSQEHFQECARSVNLQELWENQNQLNRLVSLESVEDAKSHLEPTHTKMKNQLLVEAVKVI